MTEKSLRILLDQMTMGNENGANEVLFSNEDVSDGGVTDAEDS